MFSKRHYEAVAQAMQNALAGNGETSRFVWSQCCRSLADMFSQCDKGTFQYDRFLAACEPGANVRAKPFPITLIGDAGHAEAQAATVARLTDPMMRDSSPDAPPNRYHKHGA